GDEVIGGVGPQDQRRGQGGVAEGTRGGPGGGDRDRTASHVGAGSPVHELDRVSGGVAADHPATKRGHLEVAGAHLEPHAHPAREVRTQAGGGERRDERRARGGWRGRRRAEGRRGGGGRRGRRGGRGRRAGAVEEAW